MLEGLKFPEGTPERAVAADRLLFAKEFTQQEGNSIDAAIAAARAWPDDDYGYCTARGEYISRRAAVELLQEFGRLPRLSCAYAYSPRENIGSNGRDHAVTLDPIHVGRLVRQPGDPLCKPARKFWGLYDHPDRQPTCKTCRSIMARLGIAA